MFSLPPDPVFDRLLTFDLQIPQSATTEHKMISGSVFSTLNEAWDKFKKDNGL